MPSVQLTVLGSGTSMGVPTLGCECRVCRSSDPHDKRTRPSVLLRYDEHRVVIDTTPDFRYQAMRAGLERLDAVLLTHAHADHILGLDDVRPFNLKQAGDIFDGKPSLSTLPSVALRTIDGPFDLLGLPVTPVRAIHGKMEVLGYRIGRAAYLTDFSALPDSSKDLLRDLDDFILDALRYTPHPMHMTVEQSLALVEELKPRRAWFTHICHDLSHEETNAKLPRHVRLAYDGLSFEVTL
jgi:phosphoribosyl 1,2-cyclic phosphate phosphodiesterase